MIESKDLLIKKTENLSSDYIETELQKQGYDVLRWAITGQDDENFIINVSYVEK